jgi:hypothetical protein
VLVEMAACTRHIVSAVVARHVMGAAAPIGTLAGFGAVIAVVGGASRMERGQIAAGALALGALAALSGWAGVGLRASPWAHVDGGLWRAATTVTHANAAAAVMAALALLALGKLVTRPAPIVRLGAAGLLVGLGATLSRAGNRQLRRGFRVALVGVRPVVRASMGPFAGGQYLVRQCYRFTRVGARVPRVPRVPRGAPVHALRHSLDTRLAEDGATTSEIQHLLGHESLTTSQGYIDDTAREQRDAARANRAYRTLRRILANDRPPLDGTVATNSP